MENNHKDEIKISLGTAVFIAGLGAVFFVIGIIWICLKIKGLI